MEPFKRLMKYIYTGNLVIEGEGSFDLIVGLLHLANLYGLEELQSETCDHLGKTLAAQTVCTVLVVALRCNMEQLVGQCCCFIDENAGKVMQAEGFSQLPADALELVLSRATFCAREIEIFKAIERWIDENPDDEHIPDIVAKIKLHLIAKDDLESHVRQSDLIDVGRLSEAILGNEADINLGYRGVSREVGTDVATLELGMRVFTGTWFRHGISRPNMERHLEGGLAFAEFAFLHQGGIIVRLGKPYVINEFSIRMFHWHDTSYSFYLEVSLNGTDWLRVIDLSPYLCHSQQVLHIEPKIVRYIRFVGKERLNVDLLRFKIVGFEVSYTEATLEHHEGIPIPRVNVASPSLGARVHGNSGSLANAFKFGSVEWDPGRKIYVGKIYEPLIIHLRQPYFVDSMRLLFWDGRERSYSCTVEISTNNADWSHAGSIFHVPNTSWQDLKFKASPVLFIRISGFGRGEIVSLVSLLRLHSDRNLVGAETSISSAGTAIGYRLRQTANFARDNQIHPD